MQSACLQERIYERAVLRETILKGGEVVILRKASRLKPIEVRHDFSKFAGELCPICRQNRLVVVLEYPVCIRCRQKLDLTLDLLKELRDHLLIINQDTIDWQQQLHPVLTGALDGKDWQAFYAFGEWLVQLTGQIDGHRFLTCLIKRYLDAATPGWLEQAENERTKIRRYFFFITDGATIVTEAYLIKKRIENSRKNR